ncbi:hypothetical protein PALI_b0582 [Pseudoalteromonas aliena SW19]|uniref:Uncharacterized protein n=1 Tax=Pseudoalteromonas aliena SW19 TaxID=1314866 RepID=A0ABR9E6K7_9GAMM|nr:hypothetical protein [Pseudoalteromonas aliena SW19]
MQFGTKPSGFCHTAKQLLYSYKIKTQCITTLGLFLTR